MQDKIWCDYLPELCFSFYGDNYEKAKTGKHTFRIYFEGGNEKLLYGELLEVCKHLFYYDKEWKNIWLIDLAEEYE